MNGFDYCSQFGKATVDGKNPANELIWRIYRCLQGLYLSQVDFFANSEPSTVLRLEHKRLGRKILNPRPSVLSGQPSGEKVWGQEVGEFTNGGLFQLVSTYST